MAAMDVTKEPGASIKARAEMMRWATVVFAIRLTMGAMAGPVDANRISGALEAAKHRT
jgi:hypothetical protein